MRIVHLVLALGVTSTVACAAPAIEMEDEGATTSNIEETATDMCGVAAGEARAKATFERTTSCALDAATAGVGEKLKLAGKIMGDTKTIVTQVKRIAAGLKVTNLNTARGVMCARAIGGYAVDAATKDAFTAAAVGLTPAEIDTLYDTAAGGVTLGITDTFKAYNDVAEKGSVESIVAFITAMASQITTVGTFVTNCGTILQPLASGGLSIPSLGKYSSALGNLGTIGSIINCSRALINNTIDVGTELYCLGQDYERIAQQTAAIRRQTDALCSSFPTLTQNAAIRPIVQSGQDKEVCAEVVRKWGFCVADSKKAGTLWGTNPLTCDECRTVCNGYVNAAGANAYLEPVLADAYARTGGASRQAVQNLVMEAGSCVSGTADDQQPCINTCLGRNANTECPAR